MSKWQTIIFNSWLVLSLCSIKIQQTRRHCQLQARCTRIHPLKPSKHCKFKQADQAKKTLNSKIWVEETTLMAWPCIIPPSHKPVSPMQWQNKALPRNVSKWRYKSVLFFKAINKVMLNKALSKSTEINLSFITLTFEENFRWHSIYHELKGG